MKKRLISLYSNGLSRYGVNGRLNRCFISLIVIFEVVTFLSFDLAAAVADNHNGISVIYRQKWLIRRKLRNFLPLRKR